MSEQKKDLGFKRVVRELRRRSEDAARITALAARIRELEAEIEILTEVCDT